MSNVGVYNLADGRYYTKHLEHVWKPSFESNVARFSNENREARRGIAVVILRSDERFAAENIAMLAENGVSRHALVTSL